MLQLPPTFSPLISPSQSYARFVNAKCVPGQSLQQFVRGMPEPLAFRHKNYGKLKHSAPLFNDCTLETSLAPTNKSHSMLSK